MKLISLIKLTFVLILTGLFAAGCGDKTTRISKILDRPDNYMNKSVEIAGIVTKTYGVNLVIAEAGAYEVDDGTGKIWVTSNTGIPTEGTKLWTKGNVSRGVKIMGQTFGTIIRETERKTK